ncbi:COG4648 family protein [Shewanella surugensis]|uniref:DNA gyrase subunit B n=1 Tax=Shewanella surugensis TaxID=212020 RepID=A0ABT0LB69_9GAMM|nr:hypothetical protein [Shewanella surugensis]MCL1124602.1 hypothetical protein [Shewanella surugensis]
MKLFLQVATILVVLCYPIAVYFGLNYLPQGSIALLLCSLLVLRLFISKQKLKSLMLPLIAGIILTASSFIAKANDWLLYYPVVISTCMLLLFAHSLKWGPSIIERLARLKEPDLPEKAVPYLNKVTLIWCSFFIVNGAIAYYTAQYASLSAWTLYNGLISYLLMGILFAGEWLYRTFWLKKI